MRLVMDQVTGLESEITRTEVHMVLWDTDATSSRGEETASRGVTLKRTGSGAYAIESPTLTAPVPCPGGSCSRSPGRSARRRRRASIPLGNLLGPDSFLLGAVPPAGFGEHGEIFLVGLLIKSHLNLLIAVTAKELHALPVSETCRHDAAWVGCDDGCPGGRLRHGFGMSLALGFGDNHGRRVDDDRRRSLVFWQRLALKVERGGAWFRFHGVKFDGKWHGFLDGKWHGARAYNRYNLAKSSLYDIGGVIGRCHRSLKTRIEGQPSLASLPDRRPWRLHGV